MSDTKRNYVILEVMSRDGTKIDWKDITTAEDFDSKCRYGDEIDHDGRLGGDNIDKQFGEDANKLKRMFINKSLSMFKVRDGKYVTRTYSHNKESIKEFKYSKYYETNESFRKIVDLMLNNEEYDNFVIFFY